VYHVCAELGGGKGDEKQAIRLAYHELVKKRKNATIGYLAEGKRKACGIQDLRDKGSPAIENRGNQRKGEKKASFLSSIKKDTRDQHI